MSDSLVFASRAAALRWLNEQGHSVKKSKFYKDVASGFPRLEADGRSISQAQMQRYALTLGPGPAGPGRPASPELSEETIRFQAARAEERHALAELAQIKVERMRGKLISREDMEQRVAQAVVLLRTAMNQWITTTAPRLVETARGDTARARTALERILANEESALSEPLREEARQALRLGARDMVAEVVELLREESRQFFHGFSRRQLFELDFEDVEPLDEDAAGAVEDETEDMDEDA